MKTQLVWHTGKRRVNDLIPQDNNPRKITDKQMSDLQKNLKRFNLVEIPAVDHNNKILAGHQRIKALQLLGRGEELIDIRLPNRKLTKSESERYLIASNALGGDWDTEALKSFDLDLLTDIGFDSAELSKFWDKELKVKEEEFDERVELSKIKTPTTKLGDLILLGSNRLICGNSGDPEVLKRLFGKDKASMVYSDPPYNIKLNYSGGLGGKRNYGGSVKDNRTDKEYESFLRENMRAALVVTNPDCHWFYWCSQLYVWLIQVLYRELGIENKSICLWAKNSQNPVPSIAFNRSYEPAVYGTAGRPYLAEDITNLNEFLNKEVTTGNSSFEELRDIWTVKRLHGKEMEHATSKPPRLHEKAIRRCTKPGDIILDSFSGSGSTLIAGEQLKRKVYAVELEPVFCDLAIRRWEKLTGKKVKIIRHEKE